MNNKITNVVIRNIDASLIFNMSMYEDKKNKIFKTTKELKTELNRLNDKLALAKNEIEKSAIELEKFRVYGLLAHMTNKNCKLNNKNDRYYYKGTLDDSLMLEELLKYTKPTDFRSVKIGEVTTNYTDVVINLTFDDDIMIKRSSKKYMINEETKKLEEKGNQYDVLMTALELRALFYNEGFTINGNKFVNFQRTASKARTGDDLFILDKIHGRDLAEPMIEWQRMGIKFVGKQNIVMGKSYETLTSSAIIDKLYINPDSILLIDDVKGHCTKKCNVVELGTYDQAYKNKNGHMDIKNIKCLDVNPKDYDISTDLWDGQSLLQSSCFEGQYANKGFLLLRNHFGKTAAFSTNIYGYFTEERKLNNDDKVSDRFGDKIKVKDVMMITTKNSMKIFKFTDVILKQFFKPEEYEGKERIDKEHMVWLWYKKNMLKKWGICKYEKSSKYDEFQQLTYQVINSLDLSEEDIYKLAEAYINHINLINRYPAFFKKHIGDKENDDVKSTLMLKLLMISDLMSETQWYKNYRNSQVDNLKNRAKCGKILIPNTDYAVLLGNPFEMLRSACGDKIESSLHVGFECYCPKFDNDVELTGFRSPHILDSNSALLKNKHYDEFKWFKLNNNILVVNFFGDGAILSNIWNGCDTDSDSVLIGDNPTLLTAVRKIYADKSKLVPINKVPEKEIILDFTPSNVAKVDNKLSNDFIGRICNMAEQLQSLYHHAKRNEKTNVLPDIYNDLCLLEVMSNIAIDSAKREYKCNLQNELSRIRKHYYLTEKGAIIKGKSATVTKVTYRKNISATDAAKYIELSSKSEDKLTDDDKKLISKITNPIEKKSIVKPDFLKKVQKNNKSGNYIKLDTPMDILGKLINKHIKRAKGSVPIWICDILVNNVKYDDVSTTRIKSIKDEAIKATKLINKKFAEQKKGISWDKTFAEIDNISNAVIEYIQKFDKLTVVEICRLIRDVYDYKEKRDENNKLIKDENGKKIIERDKRDKKLINHKAGGNMLQWVYEAHEDLFLSAIKANTGKSTYVFEDELGDYEDLGKRYSIVEWEDPEKLYA